MPETRTTEKALAPQRAELFPIWNATSTPTLVLKCVVDPLQPAALAVSLQNCVKLLKMLTGYKRYLLEFSTTFSEAQ